MEFSSKVLIASIILLVDTVVFVLPLMALFSIYILFARPLWFKEWIEELYSDKRFGIN